MSNRQDTEHFTAARIHPNIRTHSIHHIDGLRFTQFPWSRIKRIWFRCQRTDRTHIDQITGQLTGNCFFKIGCDLRIFAAINQAKIVNTCNLGRKTNTARTLNAPGHDRFDQRAHLFFFNSAFIFLVTRTVTPISHGLILQITLTALITDRAIKGMVDEQKFHHPLTGFFDHWCVGEKFRRRALGAGP